MAKPFDRSMPITTRTLAGTRYRSDSTQINQFHWVGRLAAGGLDAALKKQELNDDPMVALSLPASFTGRLGHSIEGLKVSSKEAQRWRRLLTLVMMSSAVERFLLAAASVAAASDPLLIAGFPKLLDGVSLMRRGMKPPPRDLGGLITGDWNQRIACYRALFGDAPTGLIKATSELERLRADRNRVAHALGVDDGYRGGQLTPQVQFASLLFEARKPALTPRISVSENRIETLMRTTQSVVDAIDGHLASEFIGAYEIMAVWLSWSEDPDRFEKRAAIDLHPKKKAQSERFQNVVGDLFGTTPGTDYIKEMTEYVGTT